MSGPPEEIGTRTSTTEECRRTSASGPPDETREDLLLQRRMGRLYIERLERQLAEARAERDAAVRERDEMRKAAPNADVAYWQDRCLDHATALDAMRVRAVHAECLNVALSFVACPEHETVTNPKVLRDCPNCAALVSPDGPPETTTKGTT